MFNDYTKHGINNELIEKLTYAEPKNKSSLSPNKYYYTGDLQIRNSGDNYLNVIKPNVEIDKGYNMTWAKVAYINAFTRPINDGTNFQIKM